MPNNLPYNYHDIKILYFIGSLIAGGKERRLVELLSYLKSCQNYDMMLVLAHSHIQYKNFFSLNIPYIVLPRKLPKKDPSLFFQFYRICKDYQPTIIHTWGSMPTFYALPTSLIKKIPLINSQITNASPKFRKLSISNIIARVNFKLSKRILANSKAGLESYKVPKDKSFVIYNGVSLNRFVNLPSISTTKAEYNINTDFQVIMIASFSNRKDFDRYLDLAKCVSLIRNDISFIATGDGISLSKMKDRCTKENIPNIIFTGGVSNVEELINISDIGVLFTQGKAHGEGIPNVILECMALGKPVIANDTGGTKEILKNGINGYLLKEEPPDEIANIVISLIDNPKKRFALGKNGKNFVHNFFTIERMGKEFERVYRDVLA